MEQNWLRLLPSVLSEAQHLPESAGTADELFAALWERLCHTSAEVQQQGLDQLKQALAAVTDATSAELMAIATAVQLAQSSSSKPDWQAIAELCQPFSISHPVLFSS